MTTTYRTGMICVTALLVLGLTSPALALTTYNVTIDTSAVSGTAGKLAFDLISSIGFNHADILNFSTDGTLGLPETEGGLVTGDLILGINPAPFTRIDAEFFFNEIAVIFKSFGKKITFTLQLSEVPPGAGQLPDEFALFLLNAAGLPLFPTSDPSGANALFAIDITGVPGGKLSVFTPTIFTAPNTLQIAVPSPNLPPVCGDAQASPNVLWPPNHKIVGVSILGVTDPDGDPVTVQINQILQDEPTNGTGDGDTCPDGQGIGAAVAGLRAERSGNGNGRVYTILFTATDGRGGSCPGRVQVCVPHDQGKGSSCVDDGPSFDSTKCP